MCEVVEISDDEESSAPENDVGIISKDECLNYDLPQQNTCLRPGEDTVASSSGTNLRSSFIGMGFAPALVNKAIEENGEGNPELLLETLFAYSELQQPKTESFDDGLFPEGGDHLAANPHAMEAFHRSESSDSLNRLFGKDANKRAYCGGDFPLKEEPDVGNGISDEKMASLIKMNFTQDEVRFAMDRLGKHASIGQLMDLIFAARMARKYEKDANNPIPVDEDCDNEALFGIMEKTLRLLEMGFTENEISAAFERCGSEAALPELADSIFAGDTGPNSYKYSSSWSNFSGQIRCPSLKRKVGDDYQPFDSFYIKTEELSLDVASQVGTSSSIEKLKGKMPEEEYANEPNNWKEPKEEFVDDSSNSVDLTWLEARKRNSASTSNRAAASRRRISRMEFEEEDRKPTLSIPNRCRSLTSVVAKPPYFLYGNVMNLSHDSWVKISQFLYSLQPEFANTQSYSALRRRDGYVHNLPSEDRFHILPKGPMSIEEAIPHAGKWWPSWDDRKQLAYINCETNGVSLLCDRLGRKLAESNGQPSAEQQRNLLQQCEAKSLIWVGNCKLGPLEPEHLEQIMGYPLHHSRVAGFSSTDRLKSLKLSFQTDTLGYHLSVLRRLYHGGVTVLSFFTGIGGAEVALHRLGIHLKGVVSVEPCEIKRRIVKKWWENSGQRGELIQIESIHKLSSNRLEDLIKMFSGFDLVICQNPYSGANCDSLAGLDFSMFVEFVRVLQRVRSTMERNR